MVKVGNGKGTRTTVILPIFDSPTTKQKTVIYSIFAGQPETKGERALK
jgi:hypothetical protein